jgi:hypothetical protein
MGQVTFTSDTRDTGSQILTCEYYYICKQGNGKKSSGAGNSQQMSCVPVLKSHKPTTCHTTSLRYILILSLYLRLDLQSDGIVPVNVATKILWHFCSLSSHSP